jgi:hypothetical protein
MNYPGVEYGVILSDPGLRRGVVRETHAARRSAQTTGSSLILRRWLALTLHLLATRIDPTPRVTDLRPASAVR